MSCVHLETRSPRSHALHHHQHHLLDDRVSTTQGYPCELVVWIIELGVGILELVVWILELVVWILELGVGILTRLESEWLRIVRGSNYHSHVQHDRTPVPLALFIALSLITIIITIIIIIIIIMLGSEHYT